jgi:hypothetical protein
VFDAVIIAATDAEPAARTLATLIEGVVEGVLGRAILLAPRETDDLLRLADAAGCRFVAPVAGEMLRPHLATAHVLAVRAGALLAPGWPEMLRRELARRGAPGEGRALAFRPAALGATVRLQALAAGRRVPLDHGALAPRALVTAHGFDGSSLKAQRVTIAAHLRVSRTP